MSTDTITDPGFAHEEAMLFGEPDAGNAHEDQADDAAAAGSPLPPERVEPGKPGPKPNPASKRQQKLAAAAARRNTLTPPTKRPAPAAKAAAGKPAAAAKATDAQTEIYQRGAIAVLGWVARPLALGSLAAGLSTMNPRLTEPKRDKAIKLANALTLDSLTIAAYERPLAEGMAQAAPHIPFLAQALERAAAISPYASLVEAGMGVVLQVLCNHGIVPVSDTLGTLSPEALAAAAGVPLSDSEG